MEQLALWQMLYDSTGGSQWSECSTSYFNPCICPKVLCTDGKYIEEFRLVGQDLSGTIPPQITKIETLTLLNLRDNPKISGTSTGPMGGSLLPEICATRCSLSEYA